MTETLPLLMTQSGRTLPNGENFPRHRNKATITRQAGKQARRQGGGVAAAAAAFSYQAL